MRLVTFAGVCKELGEGQYAANETTHLIVTGGMSAGVRYSYAFFLPLDMIRLILALGLI